MKCPFCIVVMIGGQLSVLCELTKMNGNLMMRFDIYTSIKDAKSLQAFFFENLYNFCTNMYLT